MPVTQITLETHQKTYLLSSKDNHFTKREKKSINCLAYLLLQQYKKMASMFFILQSILIIQTNQRGREAGREE